MSFPPSPSLPACPHADTDMLFHCALCQAPICTHCAVPIDEGIEICAPCVAQLGTMSSLQNTHGAFPVFTMAFCGLLAMLYFVSTLPSGIEVNYGVLALANLDVGAITQGHEYWRLITANLFHANLMHLAFNAFSLLIFGSLLEKQIGWPMLLLWMVISLIGCDMASILFDVPRSIGASGIAYGLQTGFISFHGKQLIVNRLQETGKTLQSLFGYLLIMLAINAISTDQINIYGHLGGALAGFLCALVYPIRDSERSHPYIRTVMLLIAALAGLFGSVV